MKIRPFTICCLLYGDYPEHADRLLRSLARFVHLDQFELRVGLNNVSAATQAVVAALAGRMPMMAVTGTSPYYKYPTMRRLFHEQPITTPFIMWFDDDSWITAKADDNWFNKVQAAMQPADMIGTLWRYPHWNSNQKLFCFDQPWYAGRQIPKSIRFCTGGWWTIKTDIIYRHNWPIPELEHRGGDVLLGELCHQQGYKLGQFNLHLAINADSTGKCSTSPRRGFDQKLCGYDYKRASRNWMDTLAGDAE